MLYLYVAVGGAFGSLMRFIVMSWISGWAGKEFPYATLIVNILGSFLLGIMVGVFAVLVPRGRELHALIAVGALGGFTTFSTFSLDLYMLMERSQFFEAAAYVLLSVFTSVIALFLGMWLLRSIAL